MSSGRKFSKYLAESLGTFCLVFAGTAAIVVNEVRPGSVTPLGISLVFGFVVLAMIYSIGHISGAHLNPAVSIGFFSIGRLTLHELIPYLLAQLLGALAGSFAVMLCFGTGSHHFGVTNPSGPWSQSFFLEFLLTFVLMFVITGVATDDRAEGLMAGVAIGTTVCLEAILGGPISGASMNPARSFAPALVSGDFSNLWIYIAAPILGSVAGAFTYQRVKCEVRESSQKNTCC